MTNAPEPLARSSHWPHDPVRAINDDLRAVRDDYVESQIWPSAVRVMDHMLGRHEELAAAYAELHQSLRSPLSIAVMLDAVVMTASFWNPEKIDEARAARVDLTETNLRIAEVASELAALLRHRSTLHNESAFSSDTLYDVIGAVDLAASPNALYQLYVQERLIALRHQFDLKYWPSLSAVVDVIATDAANAEPYASDALTHAATASPRRASKADFFKALFEAIKERPSHLPRNYRPTDATLASLATCALNLPPDEPLDAAYVKNVRQRMRGASSRHPED